MVKKLMFSVVKMEKRCGGIIIKQEGNDELEIRFKFNRNMQQRAEANNGRISIYGTGYGRNVEIARLSSDQHGMIILQIDAACKGKPRKSRHFDEDSEKDHTYYWLSRHRSKTTKEEAYHNGPAYAEWTWRGKGWHDSGIHKGFLTHLK